MAWMWSSPLFVLDADVLRSKCPLTPLLRLPRVSGLRKEGEG